MIGPFEEKYTMRSLSIAILMLFAAYAAPAAKSS
jgi:hypothetical protein